MKSMKRTSRPRHPSAPRGVPALATLAALLLAGTAPAQGVGEKIPTIPFRTLAGEPASLAVADGALTLTVAGRSTTPAAVLAHFFQPDCLQCEAEARALAALHGECGGEDVVVLGLAHRGTAAAAAEFRDRLRLAYPLFRLEDGAGVAALAAGDATRILDRTGVVRFAQAGYGKGDEQRWQQALRALAAGRPVAEATSDRQVLRVGDRMPVIDLPALMEDGRMALRGREGRLVFEGSDGREIRPAAAVGFFSRY